MNLDTRAREAAEAVRTPVDVEAGLRDLHRSRQRRAAGKAAAAIAFVAVTAAVVQGQRGQDIDPPPVSPPEGWVLVASTGRGGDWSEPLTDQGVQRLPRFIDADPATHRFLDSVRGASFRIMTPGQAGPAFKYDCADSVCFSAVLGPGPDQVTVIDGSFQIVVLGKDQAVEAEVGDAGSGADKRLMGWSPDGRVLAAVETTQEVPVQGEPPVGASLSVILYEPGGSTSTLYEYSEPVPEWYVPVPGDLGSYNGLGSPEVTDLAWAPDSTRLAFLTLTVAQRKATDDPTGRYALTLYAADTSTGEVHEIADLGRCDDDGDNYPVLACRRPSLAWTPDGRTVTVLTEGLLTDYDATGEKLASRPTDAQGPLVWLESK